MSWARRADDAERRVLGVDPGLANLGFGAVVERGKEARLLHAELLRTSAREPDGLRLLRIHEAALRIIDLVRPQVMALEGQYFHRQREAAFKVGQAVGVLLLAAESRGLEVHAYGPLQVKQALVGSGRADKTQVAYMVRAMLGAGVGSPTRRGEAGSSADWGLGHHVSDALALALTHLAHRRLAEVAKR